MYEKIKNMKAKDIADDVQQTYENVSNEYRQILEDRIVEYSIDCCSKVTSVSKVVDKVCDSVSKYLSVYQNKKAPKAGETYSVIIQEHKEFNITEGKAIYDNKGWLHPETKELIVKVIAWK